MEKLDEVNVGHLRLFLERNVFSTSVSLKRHELLKPPTYKICLPSNWSLSNGMISHFYHLTSLNRFWTPTNCICYQSNFLKFEDCQLLVGARRAYDHDILDIAVRLLWIPYRTHQRSPLQNLIFSALPSSQDEFSPPNYPKSRPKKYGVWHLQNWEWKIIEVAL